MTPEPDSPAEVHFLHTLFAMDGKARERYLSDALYHASISLVVQVLEVVYQQVTPTKYNDIVRELARRYSAQEDILRQVTAAAYTKVDTLGLGVVSRDDTHPEGEKHV